MVLELQFWRWIRRCVDRRELRLASSSSMQTWRVLASKERPLTSPVPMPGLNSHGQAPQETPSTSLLTGVTLSVAKWWAGPPNIALSIKNLTRNAYASKPSRTLTISTVSRLPTTMIRNQVPSLTQSHSLPHPSKNSMSWSWLSKMPLTTPMAPFQILLGRQMRFLTTSKSSYSILRKPL